MVHRRSFLTSVGALISGVSSRPGAQAPYPSRPIRLVLPFPPGGATDIVARVITAPLAEALGQPFIIDNKPGADGIIAGESVRLAPPDGHTLLFGTATGFSWAPAQRKSMPYDPLADFTPVSSMGTFVFFLFVTPDLPAQNLAEFVAHVKANPGRFNYGTATGTALLASAQLAKTAGLQMVHVPYKGDAPLIADALAGRVQMLFAAGSAALPHARAGKLRPLAALLPDRSPLLPEVPTLSQAGVNMSITPWGGLFGPPGLPREVTERLSRELQSVMGRTQVRDQLASLGFEARASTPDALRGFVRDQLLDWKRAAAEAGLQPE